MKGNNSKHNFEKRIIQFHFEQSIRITEYCRVLSPPLSCCKIIKRGFQSQQIMSGNCTKTGMSLQANCTKTVKNFQKHRFASFLRFKFFGTMCTAPIKCKRSLKCFSNSKANTQFLGGITSKIVIIELKQPSYTWCLRHGQSGPLWLSEVKEYYSRSSFETFNSHDPLLGIYC